MDTTLFELCKRLSNHPAPKTQAEAEALIGAKCFFSFAGRINESPLFDIVEAELVAIRGSREPFSVSDLVCYTRDRVRGHHGGVGPFLAGKPKNTQVGHWVCNPRDILLIPDVTEPSMRSMVERARLAQAAEKRRNEEERFILKEEEKRAIRLSGRKDRKYHLPNLEPRTPATDSFIRMCESYLGQTCYFTFSQRHDIFKDLRDGNTEDLAYGRIAAFTFGIKRGWLVKVLLPRRNKGHSGKDQTPTRGSSDGSNHWWCEDREILLHKKANKVAEGKEKQLLLSLSPG
jgi:hypothetical protein